jgi:hypothetical protein
MCIGEMLDSPNKYFAIRKSFTKDADKLPVPYRRLKTFKALISPATAPGG